MLDLPFAMAPEHWLDPLIHSLNRLAPEGSFFHYEYNLRALLALILVSISCGAVGSLVVGGRMAFFSDALAHCAFASVSVGFVIFTTIILQFGWASSSTHDFWQWVTPIMLGFGMMVGFGIAYIRQRTGLASDTVIGVFFAGAIGLAAMLSGLMQSRALFRLEDFLFGNPLQVGGGDLVHLTLLALATIVLLGFTFNHLLLSGFNSSLALSRRVPIQLVSYLFIILLALVVNLCVRTVGVLLINALLVVPAATAANWARNLRQVFWLTMLLCLGSCLLGQVISWEIDLILEQQYQGKRIGMPGTIILVSVALFFVSAITGPMMRERKRAEA
jgi:zinc transport system permease protein